MTAMPGRSSLAAAAAFLAVQMIVLPNGFAAAGTAEPKILPQAIERLIESLRASGGGNLRMSGSPVLVPQADAEVVRLPGLIWQIPEAVIGFGDVEIRRADTPNGIWRLTGALPTRITVETPGMPAAIVTADTSSIDVLIDPQSWIVEASAIEISGLRAALPVLGNLVIERVVIDSDFREGDGDRAAASAGYRLEGLTIAAEPDTRGGAPLELLRLASLASEASLDGIDRSRMLELQAFVVTNQGQLAAGNNPASLGRLRALLGTPDPIADGTRIRFEVSGAEIGEAVGGPARFGNLELGLHLSGLRGDNVAGSVGYHHDGLHIDTPLPVGAEAVPETLDLEIALERIPGRQLIALLEAGSELDKSKAIALLQQAGATARLASGRIGMNGMSAELDAEIRASSSASDGAIGKVGLTVINLDRIVAALGPLVEDQRAALQLAAVMGQRTQAPDGSVMHSWRFARDESGRSTLNGNDVTALLAESDLADLDLGRQAVSSDDDVAAASSSTEPVDGLTASLIASRLEELGLGATIGQDEYGDPMVSAVLNGALDGLRMDIRFFDCKADGVCGSGMLYLGIATQAQVPLTRVNQWNSEERWVRAYRGDQRNIWLELDIPGKGVSAAQVDMALQNFLSAAEQFAISVAQVQ